MDEYGSDPVDFKKKILMPYKDVVNKVLEKVRGKPSEQRWKSIYENITSENALPYERIKQIEKVLQNFENQVQQKNVSIKPSCPF